MNENFESQSFGGEILQQTELDKVKERFGDSLTVVGRIESARKHLEHLAKLPQNLVDAMRKQKLKVTVGEGDFPALLSKTKGINAFFSRLGTKFTSPRSWGEWNGVPGCYDFALKTVFAGEGLHGSRSVVLHEYGHALGHLLKLDYSKTLVEAHKRLYDRLTYYLQQGKPGNFTGRQELLAESFAGFFTLSQEQFVSIYDEQLYLFWSQSIADV